MKTPTHNHGSKSWESKYWQQISATWGRTEADIVNKPGIVQLITADQWF